MMGFISTCNNDRIIEMREPTTGLQLPASHYESLISIFKTSQKVLWSHFMQRKVYVMAV